MSVDDRAAIWQPVLARIARADWDGFDADFLPDALLCPEADHDLHTCSGIYQPHESFVKNIAARIG